MSEKKRNWKQKTAVGLVTAATSAGVLVGSAFDSPADLLSPDGGQAPPALIAESAAQDATDTLDTEDSTDAGEERGQRRSAVRRLVSACPTAVRAAVGLPLWCAGWLITSALSALWQISLTPLGGKLLAWFLTAIAAVLVFTLTAKAIFPNTPLKKLLRPRTILPLAGCIALLSAVDTVLTVLWKDYPPVGRALRGAAGALAVAIACLALWRRMRRKEQTANDPPQEREPASDPRTGIERRAMALADTVCEPIRK